MVASFRSPSLFLSFLTPHLLASHLFFLPLFALLSLSLSLSYSSSLSSRSSLQRDVSIRILYFLLYPRPLSPACTCLFYPQSHSPVTLTFSLFFVFFFAVPSSSSSSSSSFSFSFFSLPLALPATSPGSSCSSRFTTAFFYLGANVLIACGLSSRPLPDRHALPSIVLSSMPAHPRPASCPDNQRVTVSI